MFTPEHRWAMKHGKKSADYSYKWSLQCLCFQTWDSTGNNIYVADPFRNSLYSSSLSCNYCKCADGCAPVGQAMSGPWVYQSWVPGHTTILQMRFYSGQMCGTLQEHGRLPPQLLLQCNKPRLWLKSICETSGYLSTALSSDALQASPVKVHKDHPIYLIAVFNMPDKIRQSYIAMHSWMLVPIKLHSGMLLSMLQTLSCQGRGTLPSRCCQGLWLIASLYWNSLSSPRSQYVTFAVYSTPGASRWHHLVV